MTVKYALSEQQVSSSLQDENIILHLDKGMYYSLNEVGTFIWEVLRIAPLELIKIIEQVQNNYEVDEQTCKHDVESLIQELVNVELLVIV